MTISSTSTRKSIATGNGVTTAFPFSFKVFTTADVLVVLTDLSLVETTQTLTSQYTVLLNTDQDSNPGGTVTMVAAPATGYLLTVASQVAQTQGVLLTSAGGFFPEVINTALDKATVLVQDLQEKIGRALLTNISSSITPSALVAQLQGYVTAAGTSASNAATSATNAAASAVSAAASLASVIAAAVTNTSTNVFSNKTLLASGPNTVEATSGPGASQLGNRNRIQNGECLVQQRTAVGGITGATAGVTSGIYGAVDRFGFALGNAAVTGVFNIGASNLVINSNTTPCVLVTCATAYTPTSTNSVTPIFQRIEGNNSFDLNNSPASLSFWFQGTVAGNYAVQITDSTGSQSYSTTFAYAVGGAPQYVSISVPTLPALTGNVKGTGTGLQVLIGAVGGSAATGSWVSSYVAGVAGVVNWCGTNGNYIAATRIQLEPGSTATPFEVRDIGDELRRCQRYYTKSYNDGVAPGTASASSYIGMTCSGAATQLFGNVLFPVTMRITPTVSLYSFAGTANVLSNNAGVDQAGTAAVSVVTSKAFSAGSNSSALTLGTVYLANYVASAEL
jgi:hypothetical protein